MRIAEGQQRWDRIIEITDAQVGMKPRGGEFTSKFFEFLTAHRNERICVEAGTNDTVHRGGDSTDDGVLHAVLNESIDDIEQKKRRLTRPVTSHRSPGRAWRDVVCPRHTVP